MMNFKTSWTRLVDHQLVNMLLLMMMLKLQDCPEIESDKDTSNVVQTIPPSASEAMKAVDVLKQYLSTIDTTYSIMSSFYEVESCIEREILIKKRQTSLLD